MESARGGRVGRRKKKVHVSRNASPLDCCAFLFTRGLFRIFDARIRGLSCFRSNLTENDRYSRSPVVIESTEP